MYYHSGKKGPTCTERARAYDDERCSILKKYPHIGHNKINISLPVDQTLCAIRAKYFTDQLDNNASSNLNESSEHFSKDLEKLDDILQNTERRFKLPQCEGIKENLALMKKLNREFKLRKGDHTNKFEG